MLLSPRIVNLLAQNTMPRLDDSQDWVDMCVNMSHFNVYCLQWVNSSITTEVPNPGYRIHCTQFPTIVASLVEPVLWPISFIRVT
jgi:hypothetical protein